MSNEDSILQAAKFAISSQQQIILVEVAGGLMPDHSISCFETKADGIDIASQQIQLAEHVRNRDRQEAQLRDPYFNPRHVIRAYTATETLKSILIWSNYHFNCEKYIDVRIEQTVIAVTITFLNKDNNCFVLTFEKSDDSGNDIIMEFKVSTEVIIQSCHPYYILHPDLFKFHSNTSENLQSLCLEMLEFVLRTFQPVTNCITIQDNVFSDEFINQLLLAFPRKWGRSLELNAVNETGENQVRSLTIKTLLESTKFSENISIGGRMDDVLQSDTIQLKASSIYLPDARFLTRKNLVLNFWNGDFGSNSLTSGDFNAILQIWQTTQTCRLNTARFSINSEQKINLQDVVEGLHGIPFDRNNRDRSCKFRGEWLDLMNGIDVYNQNMMPLTVHYTKHYLYLITWRNRRPVWDAKRLIQQNIATVMTQLTQYENCRKKLVLLGIAKKAMRLHFKKDIQRYGVMIQQCRNEIQENAAELARLTAFE